MAKKAQQHKKRARSPAQEEVAEEVEVHHEEATMTADISVRQATTDKRMSNRQKCLVVGGRNMTSKDRHLLSDLKALMPHGRDHPKLGRSNAIGVDLVDLCALHQCNSFMFVEPHRGDISYLWLGQAPQGPSIKLQLTNVHTADEIRMAGNALKFSRPLLHFDRDFEAQPPLRVLKSLLHMAFNAPRYHPKTKPFVDRIISFFWLDGHVWVRNYQIVDTEPLSLMEIGPRFTLEPVAIFNQCCQGRVLWKNDATRPPTQQRQDRKLRRLEKMQANENIKSMSEQHRANHPVPAVDPLELVFRDLP